MSVATFGGGDADAFVLASVVMVQPLKGVNTAAAAATRRINLWRFMTHHVLSKYHKPSPDMGKAPGPSLWGGVFSGAKNECVTLQVSHHPQPGGTRQNVL